MRTIRRLALFQFAWALAGLMLLIAPQSAWPQTTAQQPADSIFQRFAIDRIPSRNWQALFEYPVELRPINNPDAVMVENTGLNYLISFAPKKRIYLSRGYQFAKMEWKPRRGNILKERVIEFGISDYVNFRVRRLFNFSVGLGIGVMDGLIIFKKGKGFRTRLEPFIPLHLGIIVPIGGWLVVEAKISQSTYFGSGPGLSVTRLLAGIGFHY